MILKVWMETGFAGGDREEEIEIDDEVVAGLSGEALRKVLDDHARDWAMNYLSWGWEEPS